jgi:hypothetical protein
MRLLEDGDESAIFELDPVYTNADSIINITFHAFNGRDTASDAVVITVIDSIDAPPIFTSPALLQPNIDEGTTLEFIVAAYDPEGDEVILSTADTSIIDSVIFADFGDGTANVGFYPDSTEGGKTYDVKFRAFQKTDVTIMDSLIITITVHEVDIAPSITLDTTGQVSLSEGGILRVDMAASDDFGVNSIWIDPAPDSSIYMENLLFKKVDDSTAFIILSPDYSHVPPGAGSIIHRIKFHATDGIDPQFEEVVITVYNVVQDGNDPGVADTLTWEGEVWDSTASTLSISCRIANDSALGGAMTGFRWYEPWLTCDSITTLRWDSIGPDSSIFKTIEIYNDSMMFLVGFIFFDSLYVPPGNDEYFTAHFSYDSGSVVWGPESEIRFDSTKVGSAGDFVLDGRVRLKSLREAKDYKLILSTSSYTPFVNMREVRLATDSVSFRIYNITEGKPVRKGDVIYSHNLDGDTLWYDLQISLENMIDLSGMKLGFNIWSDDGANWIYDDSLPSILLPGNRMNPEDSVWAVSQGLQITGSSFDGLLADTVLFSGEAGAGPGTGLPEGLIEHMITVRFRPANLDSGETATMQFDVTNPVDKNFWSFIKALGDTISPAFNTTLAFPVAFQEIVVDVDDIPQLPRIYSLGQNYPNPFNPSTTIKFSLPRRAKVTITVFNILGQTIKTLTDRVYDAGEHQLNWDGRNGRGRQIATGVYLYRIVSEGFTKTRKMILLK